MTVEIIPAIDLKGGRCVRLRQGRMEDETVFSDNPAEVALRWQDAGASRIHLVDLDGGLISVRTTIPFFDHMLTLMARHGMLGLQIEASGDTDIDLHHTVEDVGITLGEAFRTALGDRSGIRRYGEAVQPDPRVRGALSTKGVL